jgi:hypothetical protein
MGAKVIAVNLTGANTIAQWHHRHPLNAFDIANDENKEQGGTPTFH